VCIDKSSEDAAQEELAPNLQTSLAKTTTRTATRIATTIPMRTEILRPLLAPRLNLNLPVREDLCTRAVFASVQSRSITCGLLSFHLVLSRADLC